MFLEFDISLWSNEWSVFGEYLCMFKKKIYSLFVECEFLYINCVIQFFFFSPNDFFLF